jgi:hypothetical protein
MKNKSPLKPGERIRGIHFGVRGYFYARNVLVGGYGITTNSFTTNSFTTNLKQDFLVVKRIF